MIRPLVVVLLGGFLILAVLAAVCEPALAWGAIGATLLRLARTALIVFTAALVVGVCLMGWAHVFITSACKRTRHHPGSPALDGGTPSPDTR